METVYVKISRDSKTTIAMVTAKARSLQGKPAGQTKVGGLLVAGFNIPTSVLPPNRPKLFRRWVRAMPGVRITASPSYGA